jgi:molecular chaperone HscB
MRNELEKNYFELFDIPARFEIDLDDLAVRYRELQKKFHPDKFASSPDVERRVAQQLAAQINAGYQALKSPLERGRYLLRIAGIDLDDEKDTKMDSGFLVEQMELREALEEAERASDPIRTLEEIGERATRGFKERVDQLPELLKGDQEKLLEARSRLREMQFLQKITRDIERLEDDLLG